MSRRSWPANTEIKAIFTEQIEARKGKVSEMTERSGYLYARSILPQVLEVRPKDRMQGGVALLGSEHEIRVHPYLFRQVCTNGAIRAQAIQTRCLKAEEFENSEAVAEALRAAIASCSEQEVFRGGVTELRTAAEMRADQVLMMMPIIMRMDRSIGGRFIADIMRRYVTEGDQSPFGMINAVTAVARETPDPEMRWRLEEFGGGLPALLHSPLCPDLSATESLPVSSLLEERQEETLALAGAGRSGW